MVLTPDFSPTIPDVLPPCCIEAEEAVLGALLLDGDAIDQIKFRLKPEHFYISTHRDIYRACLAVSKKSRVNLITVTDYLHERGTLQKLGGRNKLANLLERCVSAVEVDCHAALITEKAIRRQLIELGNKTMQLGYAGEIEIDEVLTIIRQRTESVTGLESIQTEEENNLHEFNKLMNKLKDIHTKIAEPDYRLWRLQQLAREVGKNTRNLEELYARYLVKKVVSPLMEYQELKEVAKSSVKEWLLQGMFPKRTTGILYGSGGILKTKLLYRVIKAIIQGQSLGEFSATGKERKILIYQGDERESDTVAALEIMGFSRDEIGKYVKFRFNWSFEHMPLLIQDLQQYQPELVLIDSLTYANRFSTHTENDVAYARPILELTGLANEHDCSFMLIHHANRNGDIRGSSAIFNAVSEVWKIEKDTSPYATPNDRLLTVEKSRSRSSGKKYRLIFEPENLDFTFAGEQEAEITQQEDSTCKSKILEFLRQHPNVHYTAEELCINVNYARRTVNKSLSLLVSDGLVQLNRGDGRTPYTYYISFEGFDPFNDFAGPPNSSEGQHRASNEGQVPNPDVVNDSGFAGPPGPQNSQNFSELENQKREKKGPEGLQTSQTSPSKEPMRALDENHQKGQEGQEGQLKKEQNMCYNPEPSKKYKAQYTGILSNWIIQYSKSLHSGFITINCESDQLSLTLQETTDFYTTKEAAPRARQMINETELSIAINNVTFFKVRKMGDDDYIWIENCRLKKGPSNHQLWWYFETPNGETVSASSMEDFQVMP